MASWPIDLTFTQWHLVGAGSRKPGYSDMDKYADAITNLANPLSAKWQRTDSIVITQSPSLALTPLLFDTQVWQTDSRMTRANSSSGGHYFTDRIFLPEVGEWEVGAMVRSLTNNNNGIAYLTLNLLFADNSSETEIDFDWQLNNVIFAAKLFTRTNVVVNSTQVSNGIAVRAKYAQSSTGANTINSSDPSWPYLYARWVGKGGQ
jgi:hypothetical protein